MVRHLGIALVALLAAQTVHAQQAPEDLLSHGTQVYLRWDGIEAHRAAYEKTALGKMIKGDTGRFITNLVAQFQDQLGGLAGEQLLKGKAPARLMKLQADAVEAPKLFGQLMQQGLIIGLEVRKLEPLEIQGTLIIPDAGTNRKPLFSALRLIAGFADQEVKEVKIGGQSVEHLQIGAVQVSSWAAGKHLVLAIGSDGPQAVVEHATMGTKSRLTQHRLFQRVKNFNQFETAARAFVDFEALVKLALSRGDEVSKLLKDLGLNALQSGVLYSGFDSDADRGLIELDVKGTGTGFLKMVTGKPFRLSDVPPLPVDVTSWSMTNLDLGTLYDLGFLALEDVTRILGPDELPRVLEFKKQLDDLLGLDVRNELLGALDDKFVLYSSPADGPFSMGQTFMIKVKDAQKVQSSLSKIIKSLGRLAGLDISIKKRPYHGVDLREVQVRQQGFFVTPSYAIHKDWLAVGLFPQPVQGYILRATGELPVWKPDARTQESFDKLPKEFISVSVADPRPTVKQLLSVGPIVAAAFKSFYPDLKFEVGSVPNSHEATRDLFPNVSVVSAEGNTLRIDSRSSLELPIDLAGIDSFGLFFLFGAFASFAF
jgi:hypothetical protein